MPPTNLVEVVEELDQIVRNAREDGNRIGFFAALYKDLTLSIDSEIRSGRFLHPDDVLRLAVDFSSRYFTALDQFVRGRKLSRCWRVAFLAASDPNLLIVQHLLLGMNAHINFDLGISTAKTTGTQEHLAEIERDWSSIQVLLSNSLDSVQERINVVSPNFARLDELGGRADEAVVAFSISKARNQAWAMAHALIHFDGLIERLYLEGADSLVAGFGKAITNPLLNIALRPIREAESNDVQEILDALVSRSDIAGHT